ncbi:ATP-binding protein [Metaclostridioides mangenotii]|uniref:ATP-binding protein n=1 Tax=Metaclostridioides mangenotii TaxID=1540 RepID=UPI002F414B06
MSSILSVLIFNFFFTEPYFTFNAIKVGYPLTFVIMLLVALITSALTVRIKTQAKVAVVRERRTDILYEINKKLLTTRGLENIVELVNEYIVNIFERSAVIYTINSNNKMIGNLMREASDLESTFMNEEDERAVAHWVFVNNKSAGSGTDTLMGAGAFYMPVTSQGKVLATIGISCINGELNNNNKLFLKMISSQLAMALERQNLSDEQKDILVASEKEKMRSNLLRAISHDLRTPLTGILGASSAILENDGNLDQETHDKLISNIKEDSQWLIRLVENILSVTRINEGTMNVSKHPEAAEEIVAEAIGRIKNRFRDLNITVNVPEELLIVPMDGTLIAQVLMNLLENAVIHSKDDKAIEVNLKKIGKFAMFEVIDNGKGISKEDFPHLFESYMPNEHNSSDSTRGMGIGLSICMSIIKAHNGKIEAENRKDGGAIFRFALPLEGGKLL